MRILNMGRGMANNNGGGGEGEKMELVRSIFVEKTNQLRKRFHNKSSIEVEEEDVTVSSTTENSDESEKVWIIPSKVDIKIQQEQENEEDDRLADDIDDDCSLLPDILPIPRLEEFDEDDDDDDMSVMTNATGMGSLFSTTRSIISSRRNSMTMMSSSRKEKIMDPEIMELQQKINETKQALRDSKRTTKRIQRNHKQELAPLKQSKNAGLRKLWYQQQQNKRFGLNEYKQQMKHVSLPCHDISEQTLTKEGKLLRSIHNKSMVDHQLKVIKQNTQETIDYIYTTVIPDIIEENEMAMNSRKNQLNEVATTRLQLQELYEKRICLQRKIIAKLQLRDMEYQVVNKNNLSITKEEQVVDKEDDGNIETKEHEADNSSNEEVIETQDIDTSEKQESGTRIIVSDRLEKYRQVNLERQQRRVNRRRSLNMLDQEFKKTVENIEAIEKESIKRISDHMQSISISSGLTASITTNDSSSHDNEDYGREGGPEGFMDSFSTSTSTFNGYDSFNGNSSNSSINVTTINDRNSWKQSQAALDLTCDIQDDEQHINDDYLTKGILQSSESCEDKLRQILD